MELKTCKCGGQPKVERGPTNPRDLDYMLTIRCQKCGEKVQRMTGGWTEKEETTLNILAAEWSAKQGHELKPCPFCGAQPEFRTSHSTRRVLSERTVLRCTNNDCYLHYNSPTSWHCGATEDHAKLRLATWWNKRAEHGGQ